MFCQICVKFRNLQFLKTLKPECLTAMLGSKPVRTHFILTLKWILTETVSVWFHALCCCPIIHVTVHVLLIQWLWLYNTYSVEGLILKLVWLLFTGKLLPLGLPPSRRNSAGLKSAVISIYRALPGRTALAVKCIFASPWTSSLYLCMLQIISLSSTFILLKHKKERAETTVLLNTNNKPPKHLNLLEHCGCFCIFTIFCMSCLSGLKKIEEWEGGQKKYY